MATSSVILLCWLVLGIAVQLQVVTGSQAYYTPDPRTFFMLKNKATGKCVDVLGSPGVANRANIVVWDCEDPRYSDTDQVWRREASGRVVNRVSQKCLDIGGYRDQSLGANVQLYACEDPFHPKTDHVWDFYYDASRTYVQLRNRFTGRCLDVQGYAAGGNGRNIQQFACEAVYNADTDQWWRVIEV